MFALFCGAQWVYAQVPVITAKPGPIVLKLDATGNYQVQLSDVAVISGNYNTVTLSPSSFSCADIGKQTVIVNAASVTNNDPAANLNYPYGIVCDAAGNIYVADAGNNQVKKITPCGIVSVFAGSGILGSNDGSGGFASFARPWGLFIDKNSNIYVADAGNNKIRKITPSGIVSTIAGSGAKGSKDGTTTGASFNNPAGVAVDAAGNIYVVDSDNNKIRKISPGGGVITFAGNGQFSSADGNGTDAGFYNPHGITIDAAGYLYITDGNNRLRKISPTADVTTLAGNNAGSQDGAGPAASFYFPIGITIDALGNLYIADTGNNKIRIVSPGGIVNTFAGSGALGSADDIGKNATFNAPIGIARDPSGNLYVTEGPDNKIRKITPSGKVTTLNLAGVSGTTTESASLPVNVTVVSQPVITSVYNDVTIYAYPGCSPVVPDFAATATASDNCTSEAITFSQLPAAGTPLTVGSAQQVTLTAADASGSTVDISFQVSVVAATGPVVSFSTDPIIFSGSNTQLQPKVNSDIAKYSWSPAEGLSDPYVKDPVASPSATTTYTLNVTTLGGCTGSASITVTVLDDVFIPNTFTPNGDGVNDLWNIKHLSEYPACSVDIFSRGGQLVFHSTGYSKPWTGIYKGNDLPVGTYYYVIDLKDGRNKLAGKVTIIK
jgi:gliding motility-associated-like protein